ncbi:MAG: glycoside hydrolase family 2 protein [Lentisphaeria bacterium]
MKTRRPVPLPSPEALQSLVLGEGWEFQHRGQWLAAAVPGCVHKDLRRHDLIPDPFYGRNEELLQWIGEEDWTYRCRFRVPRGWLEQEHMELCFDGLDTVAEVSLNGKVILRSENMFHEHRLEVKPLLSAGVNELLVRFASAEKYIRAYRTEFTPPNQVNDPVGNSVRIRKQPCQFGWDWGPRLVTAGVWKPVRLEAWSGNRFRSVNVTQRHLSGTVVVEVAAACAKPRAGTVRGRLLWQGATVAEMQGGELAVANPRLWWPNGQGGQPLYDLELELVHEGRILDRWTRRLGLREILLDQSPDPAGGNHFRFLVNGRSVFGKGANWIPAHSFVAGLARPDYEPLLRSAAAANMNMLRAWGGGIYEDDSFYDLCDELGLMVWQDFMFACTLYPADPAFVKSVEKEADDQVRRLHTHPSIALWCGNNELIQINGGFIEKSRQLARDYERLFIKTLPAALRRWDARAPYIHGSPCMAIAGCPATKLPSEDAHDWQVWHSRKPVSHYETQAHRFLSEFGMQSYPSQEVALTFCPPAELNVYSPIFDNHQKNGGGNQIIADYVSRLYRFPKDYAALAYLSQLNQAHCMEVAVSHFRRLMPHCMGTMYWQLNDCWPVASWSSLEFGGRWKALHYAARRFYAPVLASIRLDGEEAIRTGNSYSRPVTRAELWLCNDRPAAVSGRLEWRVCRLDGQVLLKGGKKLTLPPGSSQCHQEIPLATLVQQHGLDNLYVKATMADKEGIISEKLLPLAPPKRLDLERRAPKLALAKAKDAAGGHLLTVEAEALLLAVCLDIPGAAGQAFSDNFFDLEPGETRQVCILECALPTAALRQRVRAFSLVDSYTGVAPK